MPYASNADLPATIKSLPGKAQSIWRGAFTGFSKSNPKAKEEAGFKVAWAAVKNKYHKNDSGTWVAKDAEYDGGEQGEDPCPSCGMDIPVGVSVCPHCAQPIEDSMTVDHLTMYDTVLMDGVRKTADGYLTCSPRVARVGVQLYKGKELGRPDLGDVRVYRPPSEVFHKDAIRSMTHRPVTLTHPPETVNAGNWKHYAVGHTGDEVLRDGDAIRVPMVIMDAAAIEAYEKHGVKELSVGYSTDLKWRKGITKDGEHYDAIQTAIKGNHLAMVPAARGGETLKIGDDDPEREIDPEAERHLKVITSPHKSKMDKKNAAADLKAYLLENYGDEDGREKYDLMVEGLDVGDGNFDTPLYDKDFTAEERKEAAKKGQAMPGGGYPIRNTEDLHNAIQAIGRAKNPAATKAHIIKRAKALGAVKSLPDDWVKSTTDSKGEQKMSAIVVIDGARLEVADNLTANVIEKHVSGLHSMAADLKGKLDKAAADKEEADEEKTRHEKDHKAAIDAKDGQIAALTKQLADAKALTTPEILDKLVKDRLAVMDSAVKVLGKSFVFDGKQIADIRRAAVAKHYGDSFVKDKSDDYVTPLFDAIGAKDGTGVRALGDALSRPGTRVGAEDVRDAAFSDHLKTLQNAWKPPQRQTS
jgi:cation transport regulator ChaB